VGIEGFSDLLFIGLAVVAAAHELYIEVNIGNLGLR